MNYHNISKDDMNNGDGLRVVLWVAGCEHHCPECQNEQTWDYESGIPFDQNALNELREELSKDYVAGITFSGGDPLAPKNRREIADLVYWVKENFPSKTIWVYTGYKYELISFIKGTFADSNIHHILKYTDVLVEGRYVKELRNINLKWRGSSNQRVIDVQKSLEEEKVVLYCD